MEPLKWSHDSESWFKTLKILHSIIGFISAVKEQVLHSKMCLKGAFLDSQRACVTVSSGPQGLSILRPQRRLDLPRIWPLLAVVKPRSLRGVFQGSEQVRVVWHNKYRDCRSGLGWGWVGVWVGWWRTFAPCIASHTACVRRGLADNCRKPFILRAVQTAQRHGDLRSTSPTPICWRLRWNSCTRPQKSLWYVIYAEESQLHAYGISAILNAMCCHIKSHLCAWYLQPD